MSYVCRACDTEHKTIKKAVKCCDTIHVECPIAELLDVSVDGRKMVEDDDFNVEDIQYYRTDDGWVVEVPCEEKKVFVIKVFKLPNVLSKLLDEVAEKKLEEGEDALRTRLRRLLMG